MQPRLDAADERPMSRQDERHGRPGRRGTAAVSAGDGVDDREPEAGAAGRPGRVGTAEALEGVREEVGREAVVPRRLTRSTTESPSRAASSRTTPRRA